MSHDQVVSIMKNIAKSGCTVVCAIHQPNSQMIEQFDDILVLAAGRNYYCGPRQEILETFLQARFSCPPFYNIAEFGKNKKKYTWVQMRKQLISIFQEKF